MYASIFSKNRRWLGESFVPCGDDITCGIESLHGGVPIGLAGA